MGERRDVRVGVGGEELFKMTMQIVGVIQGIPSYQGWERRFMGGLPHVERFR